jgi:hypothetical protein
MLRTLSGLAEDQITTVNVSMQYFRNRWVCGRAVNLVGDLRLGLNKRVPLRSMTTRRCCGIERVRAGPDARARYLLVGSGMPPDAREGWILLSRTLPLVESFGRGPGPPLEGTWRIGRGAAEPLLTIRTVWIDWATP